MTHVATLAEIGKILKIDATTGAKHWRKWTRSLKDKHERRNEMESMIHIGTDASQSKTALDAVTESIIRVLGAAEIYRSNEVVIKALEVLENSADFSVSGTVITNCSFTTQQPTEEPRVVRPDDKAGTAAEEEED